MPNENITVKAKVSWADITRCRKFIYSKLSGGPCDTKTLVNSYVSAYRRGEYTEEQMNSDMVSFHMALRWLIRKKRIAEKDDIYQIIQ